MSFLEVRLLTDELRGLDAVAATSRIREWAGAIPNGWAILQSYPKIEFQTWTASSDLRISVADTFAGRIFGPAVEVRWVGEAGKFRIWRLAETRDETAGRACRRRESWYYLWGWWHDDSKTFEEDVIPYPLDYPAFAGNVTNGDRPRIHVYEYLPPAPGADCSTPESITDWLNRPAIWAHRFTGLSCGTGAKGN